MKKPAFFIIALLAGALSLNAQIYKGTKTNVSFFSSTPVEDISATNSMANMLLNTKTGDVIAKITIKGFTFSNALMQEHFNENYMESDKFPYGDFKGKINDTLDYTKNGTFNVTITGNLTVHGVTKPRTLPATVTIKDGIITIDSKFDIALADHDIKVPEAVGSKIAEKIQVTVNCTMENASKKK